jgi:NAD(P)-dependent dehydrogenase (short-subunit alcohol dehydrogenase family)
MRIQGASVLVTGGASGLGEATVRRLVAAGASAVIVDRDEKKGQALAAALPNCRFVTTDVASPEQVQEAIAAAVALGPLRAAVSCAGVGWAQRTLNKEGVPHDFEVFRKVLEINLLGTFNVMRLAAAAMAKNAPEPNGERGVVVNTASVAAYDGQIGQVAYAASKAGVVGMTLPVLSIAPGTFDTPMLALLPEEARAALAADIPFPHRLGDPAEFGQLVLHMIENAYLNGETVRLDGALRMPAK